MKQENIFKKLIWVCCLTALEFSTLHLIMSTEYEIIGFVVLSLGSLILGMYWMEIENMYWAEIEKGE